MSCSAGTPVFGKSTAIEHFLAMLFASGLNALGQLVNFVNYKVEVPLIRRYSSISLSASLTMSYNLMNFTNWQKCEIIYSIKVYVSTNEPEKSLPVGHFEMRIRDSTDAVLPQIVQEEIHHFGRLKIVTLKNGLHMVRQNMITK